MCDLLGELNPATLDVGIPQVWDSQNLIRNHWASLLLPFGKHTKNYGTSWNITIVESENSLEMAMFNSYARSQILGHGHMLPGANRWPALHHNVIGRRWFWWRCIAEAAGRRGPNGTYHDLSMLGSQKKNGMNGDEGVLLGDSFRGLDSSKH